MTTSDCTKNEGCEVQVSVMAKGKDQYFEVVPAKKGSDEIT